jgi:hypothetical protein
MKICVLGIDDAKPKGQSGQVGDIGNTQLAFDAGHVMASVFWWRFRSSIKSLIYLLPANK